MHINSTWSSLAEIFEMYACACMYVDVPYIGFCTFTHAAGTGMLFRYGTDAWKMPFHSYSDARCSHSGPT
jgi:hypothetical protein